MTWTNAMIIPCGITEALPVGQLYRPADLSKLTFSTTAELEPVHGLAGQTRALEAIRFGTQADKAGFNLFVIGPQGARMQYAVKMILAAEARAKPGPSDWVYVNNFAVATKPIAIELPSGRARKFEDTMKKLIDDLQSALSAVFRGEDYQTRRGALDEAFQKKQAEAFSELRERAAGKGIVILRTPVGFAMAPGQEGHIIPPDEFNSWPEAKRNEIQATIQELEKDLEHIIHQIPLWEKQRREEIRELNRETASYAAGQLINETVAPFRDIPRIIQHIDAVRSDLIENVEMFVASSEDGENVPRDDRSGSPFDRYEVNVLVTQDDHGEGAPVVEELHPTLGNLTGRIEFISLRGALVTNFRLIRPGSIHRANGGYLLLDARSVLLEPFTWAALKRTLRRGEIAIEDIARFLGLTTTVSLEPEPIPLNVKIVLFGDRLLYTIPGREATFLSCSATFSSMPQMRLSPP